MSTELSSHGFILRELGDIKDFAAVAEYPIVACDIKGVGAHFGTKYEGAHVISEIRKRYPDKFIILYSAGLFGPQYKKYYDFCDICLAKDVGFDQWKDTLDDGVRTVGEPIRRWKRIRAVLLDANMPAFEVFLLEDAYIASLIKKDESILSKALSRAEQAESTSEIIKSISSGLITLVKTATLLIKEP